MPHLHLPAEHTDADIVLAANVAATVGSEDLYVAWTHARTGDAPTGDFSFSRDWNALFDERGNNVLVVKASWWMAR